MNLYLDFDGVIADTIKVTYKIIMQKGIDLTDKEKVFEFYKNLDWEKLLEKTNEINQAFEKIDLLKCSGLYNIYILTTVNSLQEMRAKIDYIRNKNSNVSIICVPRGVEKNKVVNSSGAILVDDFRGNLISWQNNEGISIKFSDEKDDNFITINSLDELIEERILNKIINQTLKLSI